MSERVAAQAVSAPPTTSKAEEAPAREQDERSRPAWEAGVLSLMASGSDGTIQPRRMSQLLESLPPSRRVNHLLRCQRHYGNRYVQRVIAQLGEASRLPPDAGSAQTVMRDPAGTIQRDGNAAGGAPGSGDGSGGGEGSGAGATLPASLKTKLPDIELFPRKTIKSKSWSLGSFEETLLDKTILIKGVPIRITCDVGGEATATLDSAYGPAKVTNIEVEVETSVFSAEQRERLALAALIGPPAMLALLVYYIATTGISKQRATGRLTSGVTTDAQVNGNVEGEIAVQDPARIVRGGGTGRLNASARGHAGFDLFADVDFYYSKGALEGLDHEFGVLAEVDLAFDLSATLGGFIEIDEQGERKRQGEGELPQGGTGLIPMPPGWPVDRFPWKTPHIDPWQTMKWRKEWRKT